MTAISLTEFPFTTNLLPTEQEVATIRAIFIREKKVEKEVKLYADLLRKSFPVLLTTLKSATGVGRLRILCCDTISIWLLRANQLCAKSPAFDDELLCILTAERLDFLFNYIVDFWEESAGPLSNSLKDLFTKLVALLRTYEGVEDLFKRWAIQALKIRKERRVLYYLIETLSKEISDPQYIISQDPQFIDDSLQLISSNALGNPVGRALGSILKKLYTTEEEADQWIEQYWGPVKASIRDRKLREGVVCNLLPSLFKTSKAAFNIVVNEFRDEAEIFIAFLNIGQQLFIEEDPYPNIVTKKVIETLLVQDAYKIKVFQIMTFSPKGSKPVSKEIIEIIKDNLELFFVDTQVETRNEFISLFKQFLFRLKDSSYGLNRDANKWAKRNFIEEAKMRYAQVQESKEFIRWLIDFIKFQLIPGSQYSRIITGLRILQQLVTSNLDPEIHCKIEINFPYKLSIFDEELTRVLFNNILSSYDDIRDTASFLLVASKPQLEEQEKSDFINKGFDMLNDYGKSDSGAKVLQLSYLLFNDAKIYNRLIEQIPLITDIFTAVQNPIDGYFNALQLITPKLSKDEVPVAKIIEIVSKNWGVSSEILSHDSPEGCDQYGVGSAQLVLSYGWRSTKESTLLLQKILDLDLTDEQILQIGELTLNQLSTVRHRGAFSSVYPTFVKVASICKTQLPDQNKKWLDNNISTIQTKTQLITRRSGGLPFLITAIVTVEGDLFKHAFDKLLKIAKEPVNEKDESEKMDIAQVHAFNCIKALFIESQLANTCAPYTYEALELSLSTFSSNIWSVRNCSIMLFTAIQNRLFGRKKMSARVFFTRFKGIKEILINILTNSVKDGNLETLFPVLTILSKLEGTPGYGGLDEFEPLLRVCLATKFWKIRESAARALPPLVSSAEEEVTSLIDAASTKHQNKLHGHLLAIKSLSIYTEELLQKIFGRIEEFVVYNPSFATAKAYIEVIADIYKRFPRNERVDTILKKCFLRDNTVYEVDGSKQLYLKELLKLVGDEKLLDVSLASPFFEVKLSAIEYCSENNIDHPLLLAISQDEEEWTYVRSKAIPMVSRFSVDKAFEFSTDQQKYGEDIKCSALELLGSLAANDGAQSYKRWLTLLRATSDEEEPFTVRYSSLVSILRFLEVNKVAEVECLVYNFLSDDDDEIRHLASSYFQAGVVPWINSRKFASSFGNDSKSAVVVLNHVLSYEPELKLIDEASVLFSVEKTNFYINNAERAIQLSNMLSTSWKCLSPTQQKSVASYLVSLRERLVSFLNSLGKDSILGWSNNEVIFGQVYGVLYLLQQRGLITPELKQVSHLNEIHRIFHRLLD